MKAAILLANLGLFSVAAAVCAEIGVEQGETYNLSLYLRGGDGFIGPMAARLEGLGGWGNSQHAIELSQNMVGSPVRGRTASEFDHELPPYSLSILRLPINEVQE